MISWFYDSYGLTIGGFIACFVLAVMALIPVINKAVEHDRKHHIEACMATGNYTYEECEYNWLNRPRARGTTVVPVITPVIR